MTRFTDALLDNQRRLGDPPADDVIRDLIASGSLNHAHEVFLALRGPAAAMRHRLPPPAVEAFLRDTTSGDTYDADLIATGERVFARYGPAIVTGLLCSSLPHAYSCARGAEVLVRTSRMTDDLRLRIDETAQMVFDVCAPGGLANGGRGLQTLRKVRLIHAAIRHSLLAEGDWHVDRLGTPINPEDLAGTMLTFSWATGRAVERLGADLSDEEWRGWLYLWRVAASLLGVPRELLPADKGEAEDLWDRIMGRQQAPSLAGRRLTKALVGHIGHYVPGRLWDGLPAQLMRTLLGDRVADWLGVPPRNWTGLALDAGRWWYGVLDEATDASRFLSAATGQFNVSLLRALAYVDRGGTKVKFELPASLQEHARSRSPFRRP